MQTSQLITSEGPVSAISDVTNRLERQALEPETCQVDFHSYISPPAAQTPLFPANVAHSALPTLAALSNGAPVTPAVTPVTPPVIPAVTPVTLAVGPASNID